MKIKSIRAVNVCFPETSAKGSPSKVKYKTARRSSWVESGPVANPMTRYPRYAAYRPSWYPTWDNFGCVVVTIIFSLLYVYGEILFCIV